MDTTNVNPTVENLTPETTKEKVIRRGVSTAKGTNRLKFSHEQAKPNGLFTAHIESCVVNTIKIGEETTGMPSFNGLEIPKLVITFASNEDEIAKRHYATLQFNAVESNVNTIPGGNEEWKVNAIFDWMKHILNVFILKGREFTDEEAKLLCLPFDDFDENGEYIPLEPEIVINGWRTLFENFANMLNTSNNGQPCYKDKNGKNIMLWIKLLRFYKPSKVGSKWKAINNGELGFPSMVGEGCIDIYTPNTVSYLRLNTIRESIIPMQIEEPKKPNMPVGVGVVPMVAPTGVADMPDFGGLSAEAIDDMPF